MATVHVARPETEAESATACACARDERQEALLAGDVQEGMSEESRETALPSVPLSIESHSIPVPMGPPSPHLGQPRSPSPPPFFFRTTSTPQSTCKPQASNHLHDVIDDVISPYYLNSIDTCELKPSDHQHHYQHQQRVLRMQTTDDALDM